MIYYVRTIDDKVHICEQDSDGIYYYQHGVKYIDIPQDQIVKVTDNLKDMCDDFICWENDNFFWLASRENVDFEHLPYTYCKNVFGFIATKKGLIYIAKLDEKGKLIPYERFE